MKHYRILLAATLAMPLTVLVSSAQSDPSESPKKPQPQQPWTKNFVLEKEVASANDVKVYETPEGHLRHTIAISLVHFSVADDAAKKTYWATVCFDTVMAPQTKAMLEAQLKAAKRKADISGSVPMDAASLKVVLYYPGNLDKGHELTSFQGEIVSARSLGQTLILPIPQDVYNAVHGEEQKCNIKVSANYSLQKIEVEATQLEVTRKTTSDAFQNVLGGQPSAGDFVSRKAANQILNSVKLNIEARSFGGKPNDNLDKQLKTILDQFEKETVNIGELTTAARSVIIWSPKIGAAECSPSELNSLTTKEFDATELRKALKTQVEHESVLATNSNNTKSWYEDIRKLRGDKQTISASAGGSYLGVGGNASGSYSFDKTWDEATKQGGEEARYDALRQRLKSKEFSAEDYSEKTVRLWEGANSVIDRKAKTLNVVRTDSLLNTTEALYSTFEFKNAGKEVPLNIPMTFALAIPNQVDLAKLDGTWHYFEGAPNKMTIGPIARFDFNQKTGWVITCPNRDGYKEPPHSAIRALADSKIEMETFYQINKGPDHPNAIIPKLTGVYKPNDGPNGRIYWANGEVWTR